MIQFFFWANGLAENPRSQRRGDYETFKAALNYINTTLAKKIAGDGEVRLHCLR